ncbi:MAG: enoyl-[acyl-carrier protein] reductase [Solirubrobacteraceae bacterium]|jgi:enoyl-[acyl-carrier protein] reductase III|nr:enoyl-[acyl-carrier protein] reductase [Solirubrobacteraceae bacterium]
MVAMPGTALVTGGSRGIGRACALALADRGADVVLSYIENRDAAEATAEEIRGMGRRALVVQGDAGSAAENVALADRAIEELGPLRYLVCNAANGTFATVDDLTVEDWDYTMAAHARALLVLAQRASVSMRANGGGAIVAISSLGAGRVYDAYAAFGTAKAAIETLVRYLAVELGPHGIRTNCVAGGVVVTDLFRAIPEWESIAAASAERSPLRSVLDPEDVAEAVAFLLSDAARRITGQTLVVDAGFTLPG